jgi:hypothetical protein
LPQIVCNVHTNDYFFDTSRQRVDGVDLKGRGQGITPQTSDTVYHPLLDPRH